MLRTSSSTTSTLRPEIESPSLREPCRILRVFSGSLASTRCRKSAVSERSFSGEPVPAFRTTDSAYRLSFASSFELSSLKV